MRLPSEYKEVEDLEVNAVAYDASSGDSLDPICRVSLETMKDVRNLDGVSFPCQVRYALLLEYGCALPR